MKRTFAEVKYNINVAHKGEITLLNNTLPKYKEKLTLLCNKCGNTFYTIYDNLINKGSGCPYCAKHIKSNDNFIRELKALYGDKLNLNKIQYVNARTPVILICPKHGEFTKTPNKLLCGQGCPKCRSSNRKLENIVMNKLKEKGIEFETQKRFKWLGKQSLDFYLPKYGVAIECQGEQHFHQIFFNGKKDNIEKRNLFNSIMERDINKNKLCNENNVKILYFIEEKISSQEIIKNSIYNNNYFYSITNLINNVI